MRALVSTQSPPYAELAEVPDPQPLPDQALVEVKAFSLNRGETRRLESLEPGTVTGWDLAGVVQNRPRTEAARRRGARVVGLMTAGAWARARRGRDRLAGRAARRGLVRAGGGAPGGRR